MLFQWQVDISERWQLDPNQVMPKALTTDDSSPTTDCLVNSELVMLAVVVVILALCIGAVVMVMTTLPVTHTPDTVFGLGGDMVLAVWKHNGMLVAVISLFDVFGMSIHSAPMTPPLLHPSIIIFRAPFHVMVWVTPAEGLA